MSAYIPAGVTELVTLALDPNAAVGTPVTANLVVTATTSATGRRMPNQSTEAVIPYSYTVGQPAT